MKQISTPQLRRSVRLCATVFTIVLLLIINKTSTAYVKPNLSPGQAVRATLPVVMTPLKGYYSNGVSHLTWKSLQESNTSHFEIERSEDGFNFVQVGKVMAQSISDKEVFYTFNDLKSTAGLNYYRLKLLDKDGKLQYSNIEVLNVDLKGTLVTAIYPAPFTDKVTVVIESEVKAQANIKLYDNTGNLLISQQAKVINGVTNLTLDNLSNLLPGLYIIKVQAGETTTIKKLIK